MTICFWMHHCPYIKIIRSVSLSFLLLPVHEHRPCLPWESSAAIFFIGTDFCKIFY